MNPTTISRSDGAGTLERFECFPSQYIAARHVDVWLPPAYAKNSTGRFPVIYMHDGQNLFDPATSYSGVNWGIDEAVIRLSQEDQVHEPIVVGVWNSRLRVREYMPQKPLAAAATLQARWTRLTGRQPISDNYLRFLTAELKPCIDAAFRTLPGQPHTFTMGSSMGGLISLYAVLEYPHIFGGAGCVSTHWPASPKSLLEYVRSSLPAPGSHRFYFDFGTRGVDSNYEPHQRRVDAVMQSAGYQSDKDWLTLKFDGAEHSEQAWRARVHLPLKFLLEAPPLSRS
jgi:predicted alpha/beta superfamily hydrolase